MDEFALELDDWKIYNLVKSLQVHIMLEVFANE